MPNVLDSLKSILQTPIKPFVPTQGMDMARTGATGGMNAAACEGGLPNPHPDDLPSQLTKVIGKGNCFVYSRTVYLRNVMAVDEFEKKKEVFKF